MQKAARKAAFLVFWIRIDPLKAYTHTVCPVKRISTAVFITFKYKACRFKTTA
jgi:hypothetical protein